MRRAAKEIKHTSFIIYYFFTMIKKIEGFTGEFIIVLPEKIIADIQNNPLINSLYITDIGYYPRARHHYVDRKTGSKQHILIYNLEGKGKIKIKNSEYDILANHFFVIPAGTPHTYFSDKQDPWSIYWIHFDGEKSTHFSKIFGRLNVISPSPISRTKERIDLFTELLVNLSMGYSRENLEFVNLCLWHLLATFMYVPQFRQILRGRDIDYATAAIEYMRDNITKPIRLKDIARHAGYSPSHFSKLFIEKTGHPPVEYLNQLKIQEACRRLDFSKESIAYIAQEMGYNDTFYFSRIFKRIMGQSPSTYRKRNWR